MRYALLIAASTLAIFSAAAPVSDPIYRAGGRIKRDTNVHGKDARSVRGKDTRSVRGKDTRSVRGIDSRDVMNHIIAIREDDGVVMPEIEESSSNTEVEIEVRSADPINRGADSKREPINRGANSKREPEPINRINGREPEPVNRINGRDPEVNLNQDDEEEVQARAIRNQGGKRFAETADDDHELVETEAIRNEGGRRSVREKGLPDVEIDARAIRNQGKRSARDNTVSENIEARGAIRNQGRDAEAEPGTVRGSN